MSLSKAANTKESLSTAKRNLDCAVEQATDICKRNTGYTYLMKENLYHEIENIEAMTREEMAIRRAAADADAAAIAHVKKMWTYAITKREKEDEVITVFIYTYIYSLIIS